MEQVIQDLLQRATGSTADDALKYTQAACNAASALYTLRMLDNEQDSDT